MALDYLHADTSKHTDTIAGLGLAHRRVRSLSSCLSLLDPRSHRALLIHLRDTTAVRTWLLLLPSLGGAIVRGVVTLGHH